MKTNTLLLVMLFYALHFTASGQNLKKIERAVLFSIEKSTADHLIKTHVTDKSWPAWLLKDNLFYSYYYNNRILANQGGYHGQLLNGRYLKFNQQNLLVVNGQYKMGLQNGRWKYWNDEGVLIKQVKWRKGKEIRIIERGERSTLLDKWKNFTAKRKEKKPKKKGSVKKVKKPKKEKKPKPMPKEKNRP